MRVYLYEVCRCSTLWPLFAALYGKLGLQPCSRCQLSSLPHAASGDKAKGGVKGYSSAVGEKAVSSLVNRCPVLGDGWLACAVMLRALPWLDSTSEPEKMSTSHRIFLTPMLWHPGRAASRSRARGPLRPKLLLYLIGSRRVANRRLPLRHHRKLPQAPGMPLRERRDQATRAVKANRAMPLPRRQQSQLDPLVRRRCFQLEPRRLRIS